MNHPEHQFTHPVRLASIDHATAIASVLRGAFAEYERLYTPEAFAATTPTPEQLRDRWNEGPVWIAVQANCIVGTIAAVPKGPALYVRSMGLLPQARGQGLGVLFLERVECYARQHNYTRLFLSTTPFLHRAIRLYERFGFERTNDGPHELHGTPLFTMEKSLLPGHPAYHGIIPLATSSRRMR